MARDTTNLQTVVIYDGGKVVEATSYGKKYGFKRLLETIELRKQRDWPQTKAVLCNNRGVTIAEINLRECII